MPNDSEQHSSACVSAALMSLTFAAVTWLLAGSLADRESTSALADYVNFRYALSDAIDALDSEACWTYTKNLLGERIEAEWSLRKLSNFLCGQTDDDVRSFGAAPTPAAVPEQVPEPQLIIRTGPVTFETRRPEIKQPIDAVRSLSQEPPLPPPKQTLVVAPLYPIFDMLKAIKSLYDPTLAVRAGATSNPVRMAIREWTLMEYRLVTAREMSGGFPSRYTVIIRPTPRGETPAQPSLADLKKTLELLTVADLRRLSSYQPISLEQFETLSHEIGRMTVPGIERPMRLDLASIAVEFGLFLSVFWFWVNFREIAIPKTDDSTFLTLFARTPGSKLVFSVLVFFVAFSSVSLAYKHYLAYSKESWPVWILALINLYLSHKIIAATSWFKYQR